MSKSRQSISRRVLIAGGAALGALGLTPGCRSRPKNCGPSRASSLVEPIIPPRFRKIRVKNNSTTAIAEVHVTHVVRAYGIQDRPVWEPAPQLSGIGTHDENAYTWYPSVEADATLQYYVENVKFHLVMHGGTLLNYGYMNHNGVGSAPAVANYLTHLYITVDDYGDQYYVTAAGLQSANGGESIDPYTKTLPPA